MIDLVDLKDLFLRYKKERNKELFGEIIVNVDYLIVYFIRICRKRLNYLKGVDSQDLYQDSILALHAAIITFPENMSEKYLPCRIRAYMIAEFKKNYRYLGTENVELVQGGYERDSTDDINLDKIDYDTILGSLTDKEAELVDSFYSGKQQVQQLAKQEKMTSPGITMKIKSIVNKFKTDSKPYKRKLR